MLKSAATILAVSWIAMSAPTTSAAAERLHQGEYAIVADRSTATLTVSAPIGKISATMPMQGGRLTVDASGQLTSADAVLNAAATKAKSSFAEGQMRGKSGLNVAVYPTATFEATGTRVDGTTVTVSGNLTVRGVTKPIELSGEIAESAPRRFVLSMRGTIKRTDFGITAGRPLYSRQADVRLRIVARR